MKSCASICGLGTDNCVMVPSDENGRMITSELERLVIDRKNKGIEAKLMDFLAKTFKSNILF